MKRLIKILKITGIILSSILLISILYVVINGYIGNSKISAEIDGLGTTLVVVNYRSLDRSEQGSKLSYSFNNKINVSIPINKTSKIKVKPLISTLTREVFRSKDIRFFIEPDSEVLLEGKCDELSIEYDFVKGGNKLSLQLNELRKLMQPYYIQESKLYKESWELRRENPEKFKQLQKQFNDLRFHTVAPLRTEWAKKHLDYELTPYYLLENHIPKDTVIKYHSLLSSDINKSFYKVKLDKIVFGWKNTTTGNLAPEFSQSTYQNKVFSLKSQRNKYVVLDFWGSWCAPCINGFPKMKKYYEKYNNQIEFLGIACSDKEENWIKAIKEHKITWTNILDDKTINDLTNLYGVTKFPTKFIINKKGEIIGRFEGEKKGFYEKLDEIMSKPTLN